MRVVRTILGILLLVIGVPVVLAGGGLWTAMQHRDAGGAFSGAMEKITTSGRAVVVPDIDALLRDQAPFTRGERTRLRITATDPDGPAFIAIAPSRDVAGYLAGVPYARLDEIKLTRGDLPVRTTEVAGRATPSGLPQEQRFWTRSGFGALHWTPSDLRGQPVALVVMSSDTEPVRGVALAAELRLGWLDSTAWGMLILGAVVLLLGIVSLAWPNRTREIVYVVDPAQVPEIAARLGVPVPLALADPPDPPDPAGREASDGPGQAGRVGLAASGAEIAAAGSTVGNGTQGTGAAARWRMAAAPPALLNLTWPPLSAQPAATDPAEPATAVPAVPAELAEPAVPAVPAEPVVPAVPAEPAVPAVPAVPAEPAAPAIPAAAGMAGGEAEAAVAGAGRGPASVPAGLDGEPNPPGEPPDDAPPREGSRGVSSRTGSSADDPGRVEPHGADPPGERLPAGRRSAAGESAAGLTAPLRSQVRAALSGPGAGSRSAGGGRAVRKKASGTGAASTESAVAGGRAQPSGDRCETVGSPPTAGPAEGGPATAPAQAKRRATRRNQPADGEAVPTDEPQRAALRAEVEQVVPQAGSGSGESPAGRDAGSPAGQP